MPVAAGSGLRSPGFAPYSDASHPLQVPISIMKIPPNVPNALLAAAEYKGAANIEDQWLRADADAFLYIGRIDFAREGEAHFIWPASVVSTRFNGGYLALGFAGLKGEVYFDLHIDDQTHVFAAQNGWMEIPVTNGEHELKLFKRTEALTGSVRFLGIRLAGKASASPPPRVTPRPKWLFYGDSITVGACNEDGIEDQWLNRRTHNSASSYGALTAEASGADYQLIAVSGIGIVRGFEPFTAGEIWNRMEYDPRSTTAALQHWQPELVFINYGENDDAFTRSNGLPFPRSFCDRYIELIQAMRTSYPHSTFILLRGGMPGGAFSEPLRSAWHTAVTTLENHDPAIRHYVFQHFAPHHPRVADHKKMAEELGQWLRQQRLI